MDTRNLRKNKAVRLQAAPTHHVLRFTHQGVSRTKEPPMSDLLARYPLVIEVAVRWGDMDAFQHVNNAMYFRYLESARIAYFQRLDVSDFTSNQGIGPILAATSCRFRFPVTFPDTLLIGARVAQLGDDRFLMEHRIVSQRHDRLAAEGDGLIVMLDYGTGKKVSLPDVVRTRILELEKAAENEVEGMVFS
jgi:acyl-CoA thioester hydrolase